MKCRLCNASADQVFVDLGHHPPSNAYLTLDQLSLPEPTFPLKAFVCNECWLVQLPMHASSSELFTESYAYFSSISSTWVDHAKRYVSDVVERFELGSHSFIVEVASNDGYLLQFVKDRGIRCLGIEPTTSTATVAREKGIDTIEEFFGSQFAQQMVKEFGPADLLTGNNVLAHVPDLNDFVTGVAIALSNEGVATFEFPHLMQLVRGRQFDTIYHEHFSYLSLSTVDRLFAANGLRIFDVEELPTHGGSLRVFATPDGCSKHETTTRVARLLQRESTEGMQTFEYYSSFQPQVEKIKTDLLAFLDECTKAGKTVCGYGAAAKGNTLLNFAGVTNDQIPFVCDAASFKQGRFLPGSHIPIVTPGRLNWTQPDHVLILPWNIASEIVAEQAQNVMTHVQFQVAVPEMRTLQPLQSRAA